MSMLFFGSEQAEGLMEGVRRNRGWILALGILLVVLGGVAMVLSVATTIASVLVFALLMIVGGVMRLVGAFRAKDWGGLLLLALTGVLAIVVGAMSLRDPAAAALALTLLFAAFFLALGLIRIVTAIALRYGSWGWSVFSGAVTAILGLLLFIDWPVSGLWFIGFCVALDLMVEGWGWIMLAMAARRS